MVAERGIHKKLRFCLLQIQFKLVFHCLYQSVSIFYVFVYVKRSKMV